ncbi:MAG: S8 family peptidase [Bacteroidales bacterium]|nr:S8 family peptidase [Bacteroidales bacterium]
MKRLFTLLVLLGFCFSIKAQVAPDKYWVQFTDKNNTPYFINKPEEFLGERAIQRRQDYGIAIDQYDIPVNPSYLQAVAQTGATILHPSKWLNGVTVEVTNQSVLQAIQALPFVQKTRVLEDDSIKQRIKEETYFSNDFVPVSEDKMYSRTYHGMATPQISQLNGIPLHTLGFKGQGMWIGICDGGFDYVDQHEAFQSMYEENRFLGAKDFVYKNGVVYTDSSHGTSCLGLMAANVPDKYVGTAPLASYFLCRTENVNSENVLEEYNWVSAAEYLDSLGIDVISTSLGYITFDNAQFDHVYSDLDGETCVITIGSEIACSRGILCITSAGNEGGNAFPYISAPADGKNVLTIGAVGTDGERAYFSSIGPTYDGRIKPDVMAHGYGTTVVSPGEGAYYDGSGTSFACPVLAGMATCLWQAQKELPAAEIREALRKSGNMSTPDNYYGYGIPDIMDALNTLFLEENSDFVINSVISVYPNPSNGAVDVKLEIEGKANVKVYNQIGKLLYNNTIMSDNANGLDVFLSNIGEGVYFINVVGDEKNITTKFIKY